MVNLFFIILISFVVGVYVGLKFSKPVYAFLDKIKTLYRAMTNKLSSGGK